MTQTIAPGPRSGSVCAPASKSQAHRILICAALTGRETVIECSTVSNDIAATADCLRALGYGITLENGIIRVYPADVRGTRRLLCGESGSTLRFLLPVVGALGANAVFHMEGRLPERPLAPLDGELEAHGMTLSRRGSELECSGRLRGGEFTLPGNISSQYISGLLLALPLLPEDSILHVIAPVESADYIAMTESALTLSGVRFDKRGSDYYIPGNQKYSMPRSVSVEGDYSSAAFFLCMGALSADGVCVSGLSPDSRQGDRRITNVLRSFGAEVSAHGDSVFVSRRELRGITIDAAMIPDLIPTLSVIAAAADGETRIINAGRLRLKESDRLNATCRMLSALGADIYETDSGLVICGKPMLSGGTADSFGDHRIAMSAAVAAGICRSPVVITAAECAAKSYPRFWDDINSLEVR